MPFRAAGRIYQYAVRTIIRAVAAVTVLFGVALLIGGHQRFDHVPAFTAAATVPGSFLTWGCIAVATGVWTTAASLAWHRRCVLAGLLAQTVYFTFFTVTLTTSEAQQPTSPFTGTAVFGGYAVICAVCFATGHELGKVPY